MEIEGILNKYGYETKTGRIRFKYPCMKIICDILGIDYYILSKNGKFILFSDMITHYVSTYSNRGINHYINTDKNYYESIK